ncbi:MAG: hypothetical protein KDK62_07500 [Chlamydiia bacterium]|nr:hypothetical protein [Chlamydiia bacterium]
MKTKLFKGTDFYDSEFIGFHYKPGVLRVLIELWKTNRVILEFKEVKSFSLDSFDANAIPYIYDNPENMPEEFKNLPCASEMKHFGLEDISKKPFLYVLCSEIRLIDV